MSQKSFAFKKLAALTLSASVCTTMVRAETPTEKFSMRNILISAGCVAGSILALSFGSYFAWAELFANKVLSAAKALAKELDKDTPDIKKVNKLSMEFTKLLNNTTTNGDAEESPSPNVDTLEATPPTYSSVAACRTGLIALIGEKFSEKQEQTGNAKIKVNRLKRIDRQTLKEKLLETFHDSRRATVEQSEKSTTSSSSSSSSDTEGEEGLHMQRGKDSGMKSSVEKSVITGKLNEQNQQMETHGDKKKEETQNEQGKPLDNEHQEIEHDDSGQQENMQLANTQQGNEQQGLGRPDFVKSENKQQEIGQQINVPPANTQQGNGSPQPLQQILMPEKIQPLKPTQQGNNQQGNNQQGHGESAQ